MNVCAITLKKLAAKQPKENLRRSVGASNPVRAAIRDFALNAQIPEAQMLSVKSLTVTIANVTL